jgi:hypothetical protein
MGYDFQKSSLAKTAHIKYFTPENSPERIKTTSLKVVTQGCQIVTIRCNCGFIRKNKPPEVLNPVHYNPVALLGNRQRPMPLTAAKLSSGF